MEIARRTDEWGRVIVDPDGIIEYLMRGGDLSHIITDKSPEVEQYNRECLTRDKAEEMISVWEPLIQTPSLEHAERSNQWLLASEHIDLESFLLLKCHTDIERQRVALELTMFEDRGLLPLLKTMIVMVDIFRAKEVVWGVGRGSSVASFILFLIGIHKINSLVFDLDINEFLK